MKTTINVGDPTTGGSIPAACEMVTVGEVIRITHGMKFTIDIKVEDIKAILSDEEHG